MQTIRGAFEYQGMPFIYHGLYLTISITFTQGQKCSALSRLYVSSSIWSNGFKDKLLEEIAKIKVGPVTDFSNFMGPAMYVPPNEICKI